MVDRDEIIQRLARLEEKVSAQQKSIEEVKTSVGKIQKDVWTLKIILTLGVVWLGSAVSNHVSPLLKKLFGIGG